MAKVGNEAKLILRLAEKETETKRLKVINSPATPDFKLGYETGRNDYLNSLTAIISELENK